MCDYCDCRDLAPIRALSDDHERIGSLMERLRGHLASGEDAGTAAVLSELQGALASHLAREEAGILAELALRTGFTDYLDQLAAEHASARAGLIALDPVGPGWTAQLPAMLDELVEHINLEEYDLFPASRMIIDDAGWARVAAAYGDVGGADGDGSGSRDALRARAAQAPGRRATG